MNRSRLSFGAGQSPARVRKGLRLLLEAHEVAQRDGTDPWQFSVACRDLLQTGMLEHDLRMLAASGWIMHADETPGLKNGARQFQASGHLLFSGQSCALLTPQGILAATRAGLGRAARVSLPALRPVWDREARELRIGTHVAKRLRNRAYHQEPILDAFEQQGWSRWIDDPLPGDVGIDVKQRLNQALKNLNRGQQPPSVHFEGDGSGRRIGWQIRSTAPVLAANGCRSAVNGAARLRSAEAQ